MPIQQSNEWCADARIAAGYVAAMIDGEGTVTQFKGNRARDARRVTISNTDPAIIEATTDCLDRLGITYSYETWQGVEKRQGWVSAGPRKPITNIRIFGRRNFQRLLDHVPVRSHKRDRIAVLVASYRPRLDPAEVRRLYWDQGLSQTEVARRLNFSADSVRLCMRTHGIPVRSGSEAGFVRWASRRAGWD